MPSLARRGRSDLTLRDVALLSGLILAGVGVLAGLFAANVQWSHQLPGGGGFFSIWTGARSFLFERGDPYSREVAVATQHLAYGATVHPGQNPYRLNIPFFLLPVFFPLALISDPAMARAVWALLCQAGLLGTIFVTMALAQWKPPRLILILASLVAVFSYYSMSALLEGAGSIVLVFALLGILWALDAGQDELAGGIATLCLCLWEIGLPLLVFVSWQVFRGRRWRVLGGFAMTSTILIIVSFLLFPGWVMPFLTATVGMIRAEYGVSTLVVLARLFPERGETIARGISIVTAGLLLTEWISTRPDDTRRMIWTSSLTLAVTPLLGFRTELSNLVAALPGIILILAGIHQRGRSMTLWGSAFLAAVMLMPWGFASRPLILGRQTTADVLFLFFPFLTVLGLYWTRWWLLKPARTWLDEVRTAGG